MTGATANWLPAPGQGREPGADLLALGPRELAARQEAADLAIKEMGITFTVYAEGGGSKDTRIVAP